jgi:hypothetical protein
MVSGIVIDTSAALGLCWTTVRIVIRGYVRLLD